MIKRFFKYEWASSNGERTQSPEQKDGVIYRKEKKSCLQLISSLPRRNKESTEKWDWILRIFCSDGTGERAVRSLPGSLVTSQKLEQGLDRGDAVWLVSQLVPEHRISGLTENVFPRLEPWAPVWGLFWIPQGWVWVGAGVCSVCLLALLVISCPGGGMDWCRQPLRDWEEQRGWLLCGASGFQGEAPTVLHLPCTEGFLLSLLSAQVRKVSLLT